MIHQENSLVSHGRVDRRESILRRNAAANQDPVMRAVLSKLADRCAERAALPKISSRMSQLGEDQRYARLMSASKLMDEALTILDDHDSDVPAAKLAEAIECLNISISCRKHIDVRL